MNNTTSSKLSNPPSPSPAPPTLALPPCITPDLASHPVTSQVITPNQAPVPDPTPNPVPVYEPISNPATIISTISLMSNPMIALDRVKDPSHSPPNIVLVAVRVGHCSEATVDQEQEVSTAVVRDAVPVSAIPPAASGMHPSHQDSKRPRPDLHPVSEQPLGVDFGSSSAKKRRKNKKKANKEADTQFPTDAIPLNQASPCSVANE